MVHNAGIGPASMKWSPCKVYGTKRRAARDVGDLYSDPTEISTSLEIVPFVGEYLILLYPPHTFWCWPPVNGEYHYWLQPMALSG
jgi:hypothetical protein